MKKMSFNNTCLMNLPAPVFFGVNPSENLLQLLDKAEIWNCTVYAMKTITYDRW